MDSRYVKLRTIFASAALLLSATSCAGSGSATSKTAAEGAPKSSSASSGSPGTGYAVRLPIASFSFTQEQRSVIGSAESKLTTQCMKRFGFNFVPPPPQSAPPGTDDRRYGIEDLQQAQKYGYHLPPRPPSPSYPPLGKEAIAVLMGSQAPSGTGGKITAYHGVKVPEGGCRGEAVQEIEGAYSDSGDASIADGISVDSFKGSVRTDAVVKVFAAWSSCMQAKGYTYKDPFSPFDNRKFFQGDNPSSSEIAAATSDVQCKASTGLLDTWFTAESRIQDGMIASHKSQLDRLRAHHMNEIGNAERILKSS